MDLILEQSFYENEKNKINRLCEKCECVLDRNNQKEVENYNQIKTFLEQIIFERSFIHIPLSNIISFFEKDSIPIYFSATTTVHHPDRMRFLLEQLQQQVNPYKSNFLDFKQLLLFLFTPVNRGFEKVEIENFFDTCLSRESDADRIEWGLYQSRDEKSRIVILAKV